MTISKVRSALYRTARVLGDVQSVRRGQVGRRVARRAAGKLAGRVFRVLGLVLALALLSSACSDGSQPSAAATTATTTTAVSTTPKSNGCLKVPASFFSDIGVRGRIVRSGAVKSSQQTLNGHDIYEVAAKFSADDVAVWSTGQSLVGGGPTFPMNAAARKHSDQGVDAPATALPDDPIGVAAAKRCVQ